VRTRPTERWTPVGPCAACGQTVHGWRDTQGKPRHPGCHTNSPPGHLFTEPTNERCPHCTAPVVEAWASGLHVRLDPTELDAPAARAALLDTREVYTVAPGPPIRLIPVGIPATFPTGLVYLTGHHKEGTP
jgi:hypothetical protein